MTDVARHPLLAQCYQLCLAIERLPSSEAQTEASVQASDLLRAIDAALAASAPTPEETR